jgi:thiamine-monophosphate kinase
LPLRRSQALAKLRVAHGGIDISDGLAVDLRRMCVASRVGAVLEVDRVPIDPRVNEVARNEQVPPWAFCLASGGDFQFIVTVPPKACRVTEALGFTRIGVVTRERRLRLADEKRKVLYKLPDLGHRDRRGQQFADEIRQIIAETKDGL